MTWLQNAWPQVLELTGQHLLICIPAIILSLLIAVPIGKLAARFPRAGGTLLTGASLLYAIPALPMLIFIPVIVGTPLRSPVTVVIALAIYGAALLVHSSADAFRAVDAETRIAAIALGYSGRALFWRVELPLAIPVLTAGVRVVTVSTIGLVTIGALIGVPSLGSLFTDGFQRGIRAEVMTGIIATVVVALLLDGACALLGRALSPWHRAADALQRPLRREHA